MYRVSQEEMSVLREVIISVILRKTGPQERVTNYELLPKERCLKLQIQKYCKGKYNKRKYL